MQHGPQQVPLMNINIIYRYKSIMTRKRIKILCFLCWFYGTAITASIIAMQVDSVTKRMAKRLICPLGQFASGKSFMYIAVPNYIILVIIILLSYTKVILAMRRRDKEMSEASSQSKKISAAVTKLALIIIGKW